jgi:DNA-binding response OmpR family regulator
MAMSLESLGYRVSCAPGGRIALDQPLDARLVILDANVPGTDFDETRAKLAARGIRVLVMSGEPVPPPGVAVDDFLSKPVELGHLVATVERIISRVATS